jgi:hypothetical protein
MLQKVNWTMVSEDRSFAEERNVAALPTTNAIRGVLTVGVLILVGTVGLGAGACHPTIKSTSPQASTAAQLAELWVAPDTERDLFWGVGGRRLAPDPSVHYTVIEIKRGGFSRGYTVLDPKRREWSAKFPPEASTEVVASRIHWGIGYHQPPIYYVPEWYADKATSENPQLPARFREKKPDLHGLDTNDTWSYYQNPFVGTRELNGLLTLQVMLGNSDLKDENTAIYTLTERFEGATRWYVARDLGHTFGRTGVIDAPRGDVEVFEQTPFIKGVSNGKVRFEYGGRHGVLFENITPDHVRWICGRLAKLTDRQWQDAFRAGGYNPQTAGRFISRMKQKIAEGLALKE